jgi:hypothetical protein
VTNRDTLREIETELETLFDNVLGSEDRYRALIDVTRLARINGGDMSAPQVAAYRQSISRLVSASKLVTAQLELLHNWSVNHLESS